WPTNPAGTLNVTAAKYSPVGSAAVVYAPVLSTNPLPMKFPVASIIETIAFATGAPPAAAFTVPLMVAPAVSAKSLPLVALGAVTAIGVPFRWLQSLPGHVRLVHVLSARPTALNVVA